MSSETSVQSDGYCQIDFYNPKDGILQASLSGHWLMTVQYSNPNVIQAYFEHYPDITTLTFDTKGLVSWDSGLLAFLLDMIKLAEQANVQVDNASLPKGIARLIKLAKVIPGRADVRQFVAELPLYDYVGTRALKFVNVIDDVIIFTGELYKSFARLLMGRARYIRKDFMMLIQDNGVGSILMVGFISFLIGIIFAFIEAVQLKLLGAQIFLANLMSIAMVRELAPIMTGIFMAGRTGAAYAANIGMMKANDEVNALETTGISPHDFLVMPRVLVLTLMLPLLYLYSVVFGILGSISIDVNLLGITITEYLNRALDSIDFSDLLVGLTKSMAFGFIIAYWGCFQGMRCGNNGITIGDAARYAVVMGIVSIIGADALLTLIYHILNW